jgi:hypothetical protein
MNLRLKYENSEAKEITCTASDLVAFEEKFDRSVAKLETEFRLTDLYFLAWHSEYRRKETKKDFQEWLNDIEAVEASEQDPK